MENEDEPMTDAGVRDSSDDDDDGDESSMQFDMDMPSHPFGPAPSSDNHWKNSITKTSIPLLKLEGGFQWSGTGVPHEEGVLSESSSDESGGDQTGNKKKRKRKAIELDLTADMHTKTPESNADFERLLLGSPNSSYLWIQYMSFQLQLSEVEKAREIGKRALKTINFREEQEKLNVWIGLLNLENVYGTEETMEVMFKDAARHNDSKTIHLRLASIYDQTEKHEVSLFKSYSASSSLGSSVQKAEDLYKRTCKKFGQSSKVWTLFGEHYLRRGDMEEARKLLPRSLQSLEKRKREWPDIAVSSVYLLTFLALDLKTISKFAQLEYKLGDPERGKTIFEGIVDSHPKRLDLWSIYMDMEAGQGDIQNLRCVPALKFAMRI